MNGVERETGSVGLGANGEDLNVVLGRFQSWAATRTQTRPAGPITKPITRQGGSGSGKDTSDTREISYEQALCASRHRRPVNDVSVGSPLDTAKRRDDASGPMNDAAIGAQPAHPPVRRQEAEELKMRPLEHRWPEVRFAQASATLVAAHLEEETSDPSPSRAPASQTKSASRSAESPVSVPDAAANVARRATGAKPARSAGSPSQIEPVQKRGSSRRQQQPAFRDVLKGTAALATSAAGSSSHSSKSTCLTLRVSDGEQARIQACAAQANLSVSAYLRQCALGVDELRNQVEAALLKLQNEQERELPPPGFAAIPGIFRRFGMRWLRGFQRSSSEHFGVSIR